MRIVVCHFILMFFGFRGDTENLESKNKQGKDERGAFKIDLRVTLECPIKNSLKQMDVANCEIAKSGIILTKNAKDNTKLIIEGKIILDSISAKCRSKFEDAKTLRVVNLQISGKTI